MQYTFIYDHKKNAKLKIERSISFENVIAAIHDGKLLDVIPHHNKKDHPNQNNDP